MAVTYKKLFHLLIDRGIPTAELTEKAGFLFSIFIGQLCIIKVHFSGFNLSLADVICQVFRYIKLFHLLIDRGIPTAELTEKAGFSANILTRLRRDQYVSLDSIEKICLALGCKVDDILDFIPDEKENENNG